MPLRLVEIRLAAMLTRLTASAPRVKIASMSARAEDAEQPATYPLPVQRLLHCNFIKNGTLEGRGAGMRCSEGPGKRIEYSVALPCPNR